VYEVRVLSAPRPCIPSRPGQRAEETEHPSKGVQRSPASDFHKIVNWHAVRSGPFRSVAGCPYDRRVSREKRLTVVLLLNLVLVTALVLVGLLAHSLGVLAAGGDYIADAAAIGVSQLAIWLARRPPTTARPGGYPNATNIAALVNGGWLLVLSILVALAAIRRLASGAGRVDGLPVLIVSAVAAVTMLAGAFILGGDSGDGAGDGDLNMKAVLLDTAADAAAAGGVAVSGAIILATGGLYWLDPAVALIIAVIVGYHALNLVRKVIAAIKSSRPPGPPGRPHAERLRPGKRHGRRNRVERHNGLTQRSCCPRIVRLLPLAIHLAPPELDPFRAGDRPGSAGDEDNQQRVLLGWPGPPADGMYSRKYEQIVDALPLDGCLARG
jgi:cobalt-zinc-cadmium efflux system protein